MVRELVIQGWCDVCLKDTGNNVASVQTFHLVLDEMEREVDLCTDHQTALLEVREFLEMYGNPTGSPTTVGQPKPGPGVGMGPRRVQAAGGELVDKDDPAARTCPICTQVSASRPAMRDHLKRTHHTNLSKLGITSPRGRYGQRLKAEREAREAREARQPVLATG